MNIGKWIGGISEMGRGKPAFGTSKKMTVKTISEQDKKDLKTLADDFRISNRKDVQDIIANCKSYAEGQQKIMRVYAAVYL